MFKYDGNDDFEPENITCAKAICGNPERAELCDWLQLGHLVETTSRYKLDTNMFWNRPVNDVVRIFNALGKDGREIIHPPDQGEQKSAADIRSCCWVSDIQFTCRTFKIMSRRNSSVYGICLNEFQSRMDIWGKAGAAPKMRSEDS